MQKKNRQKAQITTVLTPIDIFGAFEEAGDIVLQHGEGLVELFEDPDDRVVLLNILLRLSHRYLRVEASEGWRFLTFIFLDRCDEQITNNVSEE